MNTYRDTCVRVLCSYGADKLSPYVYLTTQPDSFSPAALWGQRSFLHPKSTARQSLLSFSSLFSCTTLIFFISQLSVYLSPNFTFHPDISQPATDSCSPPPPDPQLLRPSIHHSAVPRRAGKSWADCTRGLGGVTTPCCLLSLHLFEDMTVHLKGKLVLCVQWKVTYYLCRTVVLITRIYKVTSESIKDMPSTYSNMAMTCLSFPLVSQFFQMVY